MFCSLVDPMTKDNLDTNIIAHDRCNTPKYTLVIFKHN